MKLNRFLVAAALAVASAAGAQSEGSTRALRLAQAAPGAAQMVDGEVRKVDKEQGKLTLRHGPIANLEMPAMTMVFRVSDPKMLETLKDGDKIKFAADKVNGAMTVTAIEAVR